MLLKKLFTLVFIRKEDQILLGLKKRGFGVNKWNGFGGKVEANETIIEAAARELKEECCINVKTSDLKNIAHLEFTFEGEPVLMDVRVFSTNIYEGTPKETEEMIPKWFATDNIPFDDMWPDDRLWFPTSHICLKTKYLLDVSIIKDLIRFCITLLKSRNLWKLSMPTNSPTKNHRMKISSLTFDCIVMYSNGILACKTLLC